MEPTTEVSVQTKPHTRKRKSKEIAVESSERTNFHSGDSSNNNNNDSNSNNSNNNNNNSNHTAEESYLSSNKKRLKVRQQITRKEQQRQLQQQTRLAELQTAEQVSFKNVREWLKRRTKNELWQLYQLTGRTDQDNNITAHSTKVQLAEVFRNMRLNEVQLLCQQFKTRMQSGKWTTS
jgi:hypothetical protein